MRCLVVMFLLAASLASEAGDVRQWVTSADGKQRLTAREPITFNERPAEGLRIRVDESRQYQPIEGFGASFTESSAWLMNRRLTAAQRDALLQELFAPSGLNLTVTRIPMGASDFSLTHGTYDDLPQGATDLELEKFSLARAQADVLPLAREALRINPSLKVFISPWSAPAWMKTSGSLIKGRLDPRYYDAFARYFDRTIAGFAAEGVPVYGLTMQNEPHFEPGDYPGMRMEPAARAEFIGAHLGPLLAKKWPGVKLLDWDHNWDEPQSPLAVLADARARAYVDGIAWHCYGGEVGAQSTIHEKYPDIETWMTECSGGGWSPKWSEVLSWMTGNLIIGNVRHWGRGVNLWNLALDEKSGPHRGGCGDCRGVVTIDSRSGKVTRNIEYYVLGHVSRFLKPGARRIESDSDVSGLQTVAFRNPGSSESDVVLLVLNTAAAKRTFTVTTGGRSFEATLDAGSVATLTWASNQVTQPLRLMTYNIRLDLASDRENSWVHRRAWVAAQIQWLRPDIFGMQEVLPGQKADLVAALPQYRFFGSGRDGNDQGEASPLAFDTRRFDFIEGGTFWLSPTPDKPSKGWDAAYNRIVTWARLRIHGTSQVLLAINTHWDHIGTIARKESAAQMSRWIQENAKPCERVVVSGDFNTELASEPLRMLTANGLRDARGASATAPFGPVGTFNGFKNPPDDAKTIDHFLVGEGVGVERYQVLSQIVDGRWPSDHFPVIVDLTIAECGR